MEDVEQAWRDLSHRVAKRVRGNSRSMEGHRKAKAVRYQACMVDEIVFLNRRSSLYHAAPEFLVYSDLLHTKWPYIHGTKSVKPQLWRVFV
ncbi:hypothetical protein NC653_038396 [Populus alba x Populus x berolinensis]|uniref:DEAD-box helicase OB fold domain-containing protein n=1 Tax=Populus alba x Populus x berolinensis TaxID=444605 RepID=A0AAD6LGZ5_9ROSI|nr:hypothetical protein NC653_038396 [Populus alba x Populus x berolinensis]